MGNTVKSADGVETKRFIFVSEILGRPVVRADGRRWGRLSDLKVRLAETFLLCEHDRQSEQQGQET